MARRDTAREEAFRGGVKKPVSPASSKVDPPLANGYRGRPVNAFRQYLVLVKFKVNRGAEVHRGFETQWLSHFISMVRG